MYGGEKFHREHGKCRCVGIVSGISVCLSSEKNGQHNLLCAIYDDILSQVTLTIRGEKS